MHISFNRLGLCFKLFSWLVYPRSARRRLALVMSRVEPAAIVADLGGGTGTLLDFAHRARPDLHYLCVDPAIGMLRYAPPYALRVAARAEELPFRDHALGAVTIGDALHHFRDPARGIEEAARVLAPGGQLFVFDLNPDTIIGRIVSAAERFSGEPAHFYAPRALEELLAANGFAGITVSQGSRYTVDAASVRPQALP
jgi:ubiquinone/menaquinone biosynthesis C-methylase UbiE